MTEIVVAPGAGFCYGVRRAVELVERLAGERGEGRVVTLGPLIHNRQEVDRLAAMGIEPAGENDLREGDTVVLRSHGVSAELLERLASTARVENGTCPHVRTCQRRAEAMAAAGYTVVIVGDRDHPETESIASFARKGGRQAASPAAVHVVPGAAEVADMGERERGQGRAAVVAQTTMGLRAFREVVAACLERFAEVRAFNTICNATATRQKEALELARTADLVVVVGGGHSANTRRLAELCREIQPRTRLVETAEEIDAGALQGVRRVVVTGGASTPERLLRQVADRLEHIARNIHHGEMSQAG